MAHAVFVTKPGSPYDDSEDSYHFPKTYLGRVERAIGDRIIYYGVLDQRPGRYYKAVARVVRVRPDPGKTDHYYADMTEHLDFDRPVDYLEDGGYEKKLIMPDGKVNGGTAQSAVRIISELEFSRIIEAGLADGTAWPDRNQHTAQPGDGSTSSLGMDEDGPIFIDRPIVSLLANRKFRDRKFRTQVLNAYDRRCAFTGLRLINGNGRPEVEAAHIVPVEEDGSDSTRNGIALSGTAHWMFDRGLLSLADDMTILRSRHLNYDLDHFLNSDGRAIVPSEAWLKPHPKNLHWHRSNRFKL